MSLSLHFQAAALSDMYAEADELAGLPASTELLNRCGEVLQEVTRAHFEKLAGDTRHHRTADALGADRTGFYEEAADAVQSPVIESGAESGVSVSVEKEGLAQRYYGGDIHGDPLLTIPARAEVYGHRAREFENLQLVMLSSGHGMLIAKREGATLRGARGGRGKRIAAIDKKGSDVFFWLVDQVHQEPDPSVLPDDAEVLDPVLIAAGDFVDILRERGKAAA